MQAIIKNVIDKVYTPMYYEGKLGNMISNRSVYFLGIKIFERQYSDLLDESRMDKDR